MPNLDIDWECCFEVLMQNSLLKKILEQITNFGGIMFYLFIIALTYYSGYYVKALHLYFALIVCMLVGFIIKQTTKIRRPNNRDGYDKYSFPSFHAIRTTLLVFFFTNVFTIIFGILVLSSRLLLKEHRLIDIVVGICIGILGGAIWFMF